MDPMAHSSRGDRPDALPRTRRASLWGGRRARGTRRPSGVQRVGAGLLAACFAIAALLGTTACGQGSDPSMVGAMRAKSRNAASPEPAPAASAATAPRATNSPANGSTSAPAPRAAARPRVVVLGDSLSAGLGISTDQAFPAVLQRKVDSKGLPFEVVNAGVSGDTTAGGLRRLDWALDGNVQVLIVELGANDGLRGLSVDEMRRNLSDIISQAQRRGIRVLLCGMEAPPNFGASYTTAFRAAFKDVAGQHRVQLLPFLLEGVAGLPALNQADGVHPNAQGAQRVAETVWSRLEPMLRQTQTS